MDEDSIDGCAARLPNAACKWLHREEGFLSYRQIASMRELPAKAIAGWFGRADDLDKVARLKKKLNTLEEYQIFASRRDPTKHGEKYYQLGPKSYRVAPLCDSLFRDWWAKLQGEITDRVRLAEKARILVPP